ncbi:MAG TPA: ribosome maturation factor RimP [Bryobacteraceae bacterium]|nr:ribosome maturation factor RimP [Bryobacteraceae bacterium]
MAETGREALVRRITEIATDVAQPRGMEIVEIELLGAGKQRVLRIFIDKPEGVSHADCEFMSQKVGDALDAEDLIPGENYTLEVSSPGVERKLTKPADYRRFSGQKAKIVMRDAVEDQKFWEGILRGVEGESVVIEPTEGRLVHIPLSVIKRANLKFEW